MRYGTALASNLPLHQGEDAIIGRDEPGIPHAADNRLAARSYPRIHHNGMNRLGREIAAGLPDRQRSIEQVKGLDSMGDINHVGCGTDGCNYALHHPDKWVGKAEIRGQRDDRAKGHGEGLNGSRTMRIHQVWMLGFDKACYS
jgi:hypothetical protein